MLIHLVSKINIFTNSQQTNAMLKLHGEGDPTGRGEGFSFIRISMKDIFLKAGESAQDKLGMNMSELFLINDSSCPLTRCSLIDCS